MDITQKCEDVQIVSKLNKLIKISYYKEIFPKQGSL